MVNSETKDLDFLRLNKKLLNWSGFWFVGPTSNWIKKIKCLFIIVTTVIVVLIPEIYFVYVHADNMVEISRCLSENLCLSLCFFKMFWTFKNQEKVRSLVNDMQDAWKNCTIKNKDAETEKLKLNSCKRGKWTIYGFGYPYFFFASNFMVNPLLAAIIMEMIRNDEINLEVLPPPIRFAYPFDDRKSGLTFTITFIIGYIFVMISVVHHIGFDTFYLAIMNCCATFFSLVNSKIRNLDELYFKPDAVWTNQNTNELMLEIQSIVKWHNKFIDFANRLEEIMNMMMFAEYFTSTFMFCIVGFQLFVLMRNPFDFFIVLTYCLCLFGQLFLFSLFGSFLTEEAKKIADSAFGCAWYNGPLVVQKRISLIIQRSHVPVGITAAKFYIISVESFSKALSSSMSYFTLLQTIYEN